MRHAETQHFPYPSTSIVRSTERLCSRHVLRLLDVLLLFLLPGCNCIMWRMSCCMGGSIWARSPKGSYSPLLYDNSCMPKISSQSFPHCMHLEGAGHKSDLIGTSCIGNTFERSKSAFPSRNSSARTHPMEKTSCSNTDVSMAPCQLITPCPQYPTNRAEQGTRTGEQAGEHAEPG